MGHAKSEAPLCDLPYPLSLPPVSRLSRLQAMRVEAIPPTLLTLFQGWSRGLQTLAWKDTATIFGTRCKRYPLFSSPAFFAMVSHRLEAVQVEAVSDAERQQRRGLREQIVGENPE